MAYGDEQEEVNTQLDIQMGYPDGMASCGSVGGGWFARRNPDVGLCVDGIIAPLLLYYIGPGAPILEREGSLSCTPHNRGPTYKLAQKL